MDVTELLTEDHQTVRTLFSEFEGLGETAFKAKREVVDKIIEELTVHAHIEEEFFYPAVREIEATGDGEEPEEGMKEAEEEHAQIRTLLHELEGLSPEDEYFDAKVTVVIDNVRHHSEEEEQEMFPKLREAMERNELEGLGQRMWAAKAHAPKRPSQEQHRGVA